MEFRLFSFCENHVSNMNNLNNSRWRMIAVPFKVINDVIITSLLLLKIIYVLANFLDFIWVLTWSFYRFNVYFYFEGNLDSTNKFNNMTS